MRLGHSDTLMLRGIDDVKPPRVNTRPTLRLWAYMFNAELSIPPYSISVTKDEVGKTTRRLIRGL